MKKIILYTLFSMCTFVIFAQNSAQSKTILDKAFSTYETSKGVKADFTFAASENNKSQMQQKGTAIFKGNKFFIETTSLNTWFDGKTQWVFIKDFDEVNISEPTPDEIAAVSPLALLSMYKTGYKFGDPVSKTINGKNAFVIELTPTNNRSEFKNIHVAIDKTANNILQVNLTFKNGVKNTIDINSYNTNFNFSDTDFVFNKNKYPGVEIVDLR